MNSKKLRTIIIEDEIYDRKVIEKILTDHYNQYLEIVDIATSTEEAVESINQNKPELVFLDIELNGERDGAFKVLDQVAHSFKIIFVTAKSEQDDFLRAIRLSCIDYLMKPTKISDFEDPVKRVYNEVNNIGKEDHNKIQTFKHNISIKDKQESKISLQEGYSFIPTHINQIIRCEAQGNYTKFYFLNNKSKLVNGNLKYYDDRLNGFGFCRISKSDLINLSHITSFSKKNVSWEVSMSDHKTMYISNQRKHSFLEQYNEIHL